MKIFSKLKSENKIVSKCKKVTMCKVNNKVGWECMRRNAAMYFLPITAYKDDCEILFPRVEIEKLKM